MIDTQTSTPTPFSVPTTYTFKVSGMAGESGVRSVETLLLQQPGVISATVDFTAATAIVACDTNAEPLQIAQQLTIAGFPSQLNDVSIHPVQPAIHWTAIAFYMLVVFFNLCLNAQVLTVGLAYFYHPEWWNVHVWLVRGYSGLSLILLAGSYLILLPRRVRMLTFSLPILLTLQFLTIHVKTSLPLAIVHPLIGFSLFSASTTLVHRVYRFLFPKAAQNDID